MSNPTAHTSPLVEHLIELRNRLLYCILTIALVFLALLGLANTIYSFIASPLLSLLPAGTSMIATEVATPFLTPFKLTLFVALVLALPMVLYQLWAFLAPGLYANEKRLIAPLIVSSVLLFYTGIAFAYFFVLPLVFGFFTSVAPAGVSVMTDIASYLDFVVKLFIAFGVAFEIPVAIVLLLRSQLVTASTLESKRPYMIVGFFVLAMLLTPPDVISQILLAVPMWLLYEGGIFVGKHLSRTQADSMDS
ncbi:MAG: twin-arginine translocase subunit TatC [Cellvibrionaceae bacterium]|nr:twin-arginine translocase subunit TatC [Cellvibrionaceae bacterium]